MITVDRWNTPGSLDIVTPEKYVTVTSAIEKEDRIKQEKS